MISIVLNVSDLAPNETETDEIEQIEKARSYPLVSYQIAVKLMRALSSRTNEAEWPGKADDEAKDWLGESSLDSDWAVS